MTATVMTTFRRFSLVVVFAVAAMLVAAVMLVGSGRFPDTGEAEPVFRTVLTDAGDELVFVALDCVGAVCAPPAVKPPMIVVAGPLDLSGFNTEDDTLEAVSLNPLAGTVAPPVALVDGVLRTELLEPGNYTLVVTTGAAVFEAALTVPDL